MKQSLKFLLAGMVAVLVLLAPLYCLAAGTEMNVTGIIVAAPENTAAGFAGIAIQSDAATYAVVKNDIAQKMAKYVGSQAEIMGTVEEKDGQKVFTIWNFMRGKSGPLPAF